MRLRTLFRSVLFLLLFSGNATAGPQHLHLLWSNPEKTHDNMTVMWSTTYTVKAVQVQYGISTSYGMLENGTTIYQTMCNAPGCSHEFCKRHIATVILTGLQYNTTYYYRCGEPGNWSARKKFITSPMKGSNTPIRFAAGSDSQANGTETKKIYNAIKTFNPLFKIHGGDLVGAGTRQMMWNNDFFPNVEQLAAESPLLPSPGNHEYHAVNYYNQFSLSKTWYSLNVGNIHVISLDNDMLNFEWAATWYVDSTSPQYKWLKADLEKADADPDIKWKIVFFHSPPYCSAQTYCGKWVRPDWVPLFEKHKVDIVFSGDIHFYERTYSLVQGEVVDRGPDFVKNSGVIYVVMGGEGGTLHASATPDTFSAAQRSSYNFQIIDVTEKQLTFKSYLDDGVTVIDTFNILKSTVTSPTPDTPTGFNAVVLSTTTAKLSWYDNSVIETGIRIERKNVGGSFTAISTVTANTTSYIDTGLTSGTTTVYRICAFNEYGDSPYSNEISVVAITSYETDPPVNPTDCRAWVSNTKTTELPEGDWQNVSATPYFVWTGSTDTVSGVKGFSVYFGTNPVQDPGKVITTNSSSVQISTGTVENGIAYYLRLRTSDNIGNWSNPVTMFVFKYIQSIPQAETVDPVTKVNVLEKDIYLKINVNSSTGISVANLEYCSNNDWDAYNQTELVFKEIKDATLVYETVINGEEVVSGIDSISYRVRIRDTVGAEVVVSTGTIIVSPNTERVITSNGGYVSLEDGDTRDGKTKVELPLSAVEQNVTISITPLKPSAVSPVISNTLIRSSNYIPAAVYDLSPSGQVFNKPVSITLLYPTPNTGVNENNYRVFWYDGTDWRYIGGKVDPAKNTVTAWVSHFSKYAIFETINTSSLDAQSYKPKEKILTLNNDGLNDTAYFSGLQNANLLAIANGGTEETKIYIYNLRNQLIRTIVDTEIWNGKDDSDNLVENGVYIYQYELNGEKVTGSFVVAK
ncbi:MAG: fibronectin type III domain-containing protein [Elusimicrobiota bacterium]